MNPAQDPSSSQPAESERIQFLLSRQLDGDLTLDEASELTALLQTDSVRAWLTAMTDLRNHLKVLPVNPVSESFASSVRDAIHQASTVAPAALSPDLRRTWIMRGILAVSVTACATVVMLFLQPPTDDARQLAGAGDSPAAMQSMDVPVTDAAASMAAAPESDELEASAPPTTVAELNVNAEKEQVRVFIENNDWDIVVVQVHSKDRDGMMRDIEAFVAKNGMDIQPVAGNDDHEARFGILLTSTGVSENTFIQSVLSKTDAESADYHAQSVADASPESLIRSMQESLRTPTLSDLHFGQVYMILPKSVQPPAAASPSLLAQNDAVNRASDPSALTEKRLQPTETSPETPTVRTTPVLVVFEFTDATQEHI